MTEKQKQRVKEGNCPRCGTFSYPYYLCVKHRIIQNCSRVLRMFEKNGWVEVSKEGRNKLYKWKKGADIGKMRNYTPEYIAKMQLPRLNGKPLTDSVLSDAILKVLEDHQCPLTEKEIEKGIRQLKTIGNVIPETDKLIEEYKLIEQKKSRLSKSQRNAVKYKINFLLQRKVINETQLQNA